MQRHRERTGEVEAAISWVFDPKHREKMFNKITLWKTANDESTEKELTNDSEEWHGVREHTQELTEDNHSTLLHPGNGAVLKCLKTRHSDGLTELEGPMINVHIVDDKLKFFTISPCKETKNIQDHASTDVSESMVKESMIEDSKDLSKSDAMNNSECASEKEVNCGIRSLNPKELRATCNEEIECIQSNCKNDTRVTSSGTSQVTQKEDTLVPGLSCAEERLESEKHQLDISGYLAEEKNIVEGFIIPTHKLDIQFGPEVNFVVRDTRMRLDNFMKKNGTSNLKNCEPTDTINQMFRVKTV
ncbi:hypothetical protein EVAR_34693_1 [Eumeta japonica]|uniref:Uncharacterized protein n=1 Tax=Eumeta variegata TaxID=151549 RepID=A0A4C1XDF2_EUMVA|nr:hypothetical protein EVAR_34693_1 [Eumeta japonica]